MTDFYQHHKAGEAIAEVQSLKVGQAFSEVSTHRNRACLEEAVILSDSHEIKVTLLKH